MVALFSNERPIRDSGVERQWWWGASGLDANEVEEWWDISYPQLGSNAIFSVKVTELVLS